MPGVTKEWIVFSIFALLFIGVIIAEVVWLIRNRWTRLGPAIGYVLIVMVFAPAGNGSAEAAYWAALVVAIVLSALLLFSSRRVILALFKIKFGRAAWVYSVVSSLLAIAQVLVPPPVIYFAIAYLSSWK